VTTPRYSGPGETSPQHLDGVQGAPTGNYAFTNTGAMQLSQQGVGQREEMTSSHTYGSQSSYAPPLPVNTSSSFQGPYAPYAAQAGPYSSQPRYGFPAAQNAPPGVHGLYGASNQQTAPSGFQGQRGPPQGQYADSRAPIASTGFNRRFSMGLTSSSEFQSQYSYAGEHMTSPAPQYYPGGAQGSSWQNEYHDQYGVQTRQMGSPDVQWQNSALTGQTIPSGFPESYSTQTGSAAPPELQVNAAPADGNSYPEPTSPSAQGGVLETLPATATSRSQTVYHGSYVAKVDSSITQSEPERATSYGGNPVSDVILEVENSRSSQGA
jgi:hypothetical protein